MNRSLAGFLLVLGTIITVLAGQTTAAGSRNARQVGCSAGQQCILLTSCPELLALLNPPTAAGIKRLQGLTCAFDRRNPKVCCDSSTNGGTPDPPTTVSTPPTTPVTPGPGTSNLLPESCGAIGERVFGGEELPIRSYMWMALIGVGSRSNPDWGCGGSLISQRYVITAAHCADTRFNFGRSIVQVRLGEHDISKTLDCQQFNTGPVCAPPVQDFDPEKIIMNPDWNKRTNFSDDIALIRLNRPAELHSYVQTICLPPPNFVGVGAFLNGREAEVAGWGATERSTFSDVKLMVEVPFVPLEQCKAVNNVPLLDKGQVCFGGVAGRDSCSGDSGGPLVGTDLNTSSINVYILLGVVSYGPRTCGSEDRPAVYTDVSQYRNWILSQLEP